MTNDSKSARNFIAEHVDNLPKSGIRDFFDIVAGRKDVISLGIGEPDFTTPWHIRAKTVECIEKGFTRYTSNLGMPELRKEISTYMKKSFNGDYNWEDEILVTVGVSEALDIALRAILRPGDEVLYHEPAFVAYGPLISMAHGVPVAIETFEKDEFRVTIEELEKKVTKKTRALLLNFPNNPTGATLRPQDVEDLADFAIRHDIILIADEVYMELTYDGERKSFASVERIKDRLILLNGFSKAWSMTGFRLGFVCAPEALTDAMMKIHQFCMMCASSISQVAGLEALKNGDEEVIKMRDSYKLRRNFIVASLNELGLDCFLPRGAFYVFPSIKSTGLSSHDFAMNLLEKHNVACVPGTAFGACGEGYLRCAYATGMEQLKEAILRIEKFIS
ncbi:MAG: aminotransferase class I/II-fold pyridoxal phosphate-dependent enzyme [Kiritimatiellae bacterium]|jgi:aminotransferase|nr:aminotransferase class I/II-fold pyridoxal phosphate-dependent enzyme [Kiritimatiellia bacterium]